MASIAMTQAERESVEAFRRDVIEPSMDALVILDFWAEWCGPCKQLTPLLEKVTAEYAPRVKLAKINVDENRLIATQFRVQSIPTVYAIFQGQPVADLTPARTESQLRHYFDELLKQLPLAAGEPEAPDIEPLIAMGDEILAAGDAARALSIFEQIADLAPGEPRVAAGQARALLGLGQGAEGLALLDALEGDAAKHVAVSGARAAIALAAEATPVGDLAGLRAKYAANPDDQALGYELAGGLMAVGDRDGAADVLLASIAHDREWNEGATRARLLKLFEAVGLGDAWVGQQRRRLSAILFS